MNRRIKSVVCLAVLLACGLASAAEEIRWAPDLLSARKASAQFKVPLLIHFYGDNCLPCKMVEERVFPRPELIETLNKYFICVKVNGSRMPNIAAEYNVHAWPTDVFLAPDGTSLYSEVSKQDVNAYMATLHNVAVRNRDRNTLLATKAPPTQTNPAMNFAANHAESQAAPTQTLATQTASTNPNTSRVNYGQLPTYGRPYGQQQAEPTPPSSGALASNNQLQTNSNNFYAGRPQDSLATHNAGQQFTRPDVQVGPTTLNKQVQATPTNAPGQTNNITGVIIPPKNNLLGQTQRQPAASPTAGQINNSLAGYDNLPTAASSQAAEQNVAPSGQVTSTAKRWQASAGTSGAVIGNPYAEQNATSVQNRFVGYQQPADDQAASTGAQTKTNLAGSQQTVAPAAAASSLPGNQAPALEGYCVIEAKRGSWTRGEPEFAVKHRGKVYWLSSLEAQQSFMSSPDAAAPLLSGYDPHVFLTEGRLVPGSILHTLHERVSDQLLLFATAEAKSAYYPNDDTATFLRNTQTLLEIVEQASRK